MTTDSPAYLDCNATTPVEPAVADAVLEFMRSKFGNAGSRTHEYGARAKRAVQVARLQVAAVVAARPEEIVFTSGATESNNLAIRGLRRFGEEAGRRHIISTEIEHKAVLQPLRAMSDAGFDVELVGCGPGGWVEPAEIARRLRPDTLLVSVMHVNNETGITQPLHEIGEALEASPAFFHTDAAQGFGKDLDSLRSTRLDLISISGHKAYAPMGVGALVARRRGFKRPPLKPLVEGGGQEGGLRAGTLPVPLIVGLGLASHLAVRHADERRVRVLKFRTKLEQVLAEIGALSIGDPHRCVPHTLCVYVPGLDSEAAMLQLKGVAAVSNGSACTSQQYSPSHVLTAMGLPPDAVEGALRFSWCHMTAEPDWTELARRLAGVSPGAR